MANKKIVYPLKDRIIKVARRICQAIYKRRPTKLKIEFSTETLQGRYYIKKPKEITMTLNTIPTLVLINERKIKCFPDKQHQISPTRKTLEMKRW